MMDYEEIMLQISDIMRQANKLRPLMTHEEAVKKIRLIVNQAGEVDTTFREVVAYECGQKSVEERPKGKWLPKGRWHLDPQCIEYTCSICGRRIMREERLNVIEQYPFCNCGADMRGDV